MDGCRKNGEGIIKSFGTLAALFFFISISHADFLSVNIIEKEEPPPTVVYGASYAARIFAGGVDNFGGASIRYRAGKHLALGLKSEIDITHTGFLAGGFLHYLPSGELHKELAENFVHLGVDYIRIEEQSPLFSIGYGRDMLPWKKSPFGFRMIGRIEYAPAAHLFMRKSDGLFGLEMIKLSNVDFAIEIGVFVY